jgi:hypothetical protein
MSFWFDVFFYFQVVLLGKFNAQGYGNDYEILLRMTKGGFSNYSTACSKGLTSQWGRVPICPPLPPKNIVP